jgi:SAM-dependent methyltransferase
MCKFVCNICGAWNSSKTPQLDREAVSCVQCKSSVRYRSIVHLLTSELFGRSMTLLEVPTIKQVRGLGLTDWWGYDGVLSDRFTYTNTFYEREPRMDIMHPGPEHTGQYDFIISSEVFEHVHPPVEEAFANVVRLLKPNGFFILTVPYVAGEEVTVEHYPSLNDYKIVEIEGEFILVNRTKDGSIETFRDLKFHGGPGNTLELRLFGERDLERKLLTAGFREVSILKDNCAQFGVQWHEPWSRPIIARREPFSFPGLLVWELARQVESLQKTYAEQFQDSQPQKIESGSPSLGTLDSLRKHKELVLRYDKLAEDFSTLRTQVSMASHSRWLALGRMLGIGPRFDDQG